MSPLSKAGGARRTSRLLTHLSADRVLHSETGMNQPWVEQSTPIRRCASCGSKSDLWIPEDPELDSFCRECRSPLTTLDFPEYYCDLGGEA